MNRTSSSSTSARTMRRTANRSARTGSFHHGQRLSGQGSLGRRPAMVARDSVGGGREIDSLMAGLYFRRLSKRRITGLYISSGKYSGSGRVPGSQRATGCANGTPSAVTPKTGCQSHGSGPGGAGMR